MRQLRNAACGIAACGSCGMRKLRNGARVVRNAACGMPRTEAAEWCPRRAEGTEAPRVHVKTGTAMLQPAATGKAVRQPRRIARRSQRAPLPRRGCRVQGVQGAQGAACSLTPITPRDGSRRRVQGAGCRALQCSLTPITPRDGSRRRTCNSAGRAPAVVRAPAHRGRRATGVPPARWPARPRSAPGSSDSPPRARGRRASRRPSRPLTKPALPRRVSMEHGRPARRCAE